MLDVRHLAMVRAIHAEGSLTRAARKLNMSQPALTRQIATLEARVGTPLFHRQSRGMVLTSAGHRLLRSAERVLGELERAEHDVRRLAQGRTGAVRVTTECYMCYHWLPRLLRAFGAQYPAVDVQLAPEATRDPYAALEQGAADVAVVYSAPPRRDAVRRTPLFDDEIVAVLAADHPLAGGSHVRPEDFRGEALICHYAEPGRGVVETAFLAPARVEPRRTLEMLVTPAVVEMARAGYGVAVVPHWILAAQSSLDGLKVLRLGGEGLWRTWYATCDAARSDEPVLAALIGALQDALREGNVQRDAQVGSTRTPLVRLA